MTTPPTLPFGDTHFTTERLRRIESEWESGGFRDS